MPVCFNTTPAIPVHLAPSNLAEEENRLSEIIAAIEDENLPRVREILYFGNPTENSLKIDKKLVLLQAINLEKFDFFETFLEQDDIDIETKIGVVEEAVNANSLEALDILLQNDPGNELRGLAVIHAAHGYGTLECIHRLLKNHSIPEADFEQAIDDANEDEIIETLENYSCYFSS